MRKLILLYGLLVCLCTVFLGAEEEGEKIQSLREERREILLYGIDSQVLEIIGQLRDEKDPSLLDDVFTSFKLTINPTVKAAAFQLFEDLDYFGAVDDALTILSDYVEYEEALVTASIRYLTKEPKPEHAEVMLPLIDSNDKTIARAAIAGIGKSGAGLEYVELLLDRLRDPEFAKESKPELILALGNLKHPQAVEPLMEILDDDEEEPTWRRYSCDALGKIGDRRALPAIKRAMVDDDTILRAYAVYAIRYFPDNDVTQVLMQALRDSFWRVRVQAAQGLGELRVTSAVHILEFKARKDPEMRVREEAIRALAAIETETSLDVLRNMYSDRFFTQSLRLLAVNELVKRDLTNSISTIELVVQEEWSKRNSKILERTAFALSTAETAGLKNLYIRFITSDSLALIIHGIRGIERNSFLELKTDIEQLSTEGNHRSVRKAALSALEAIQ